MTSRMTGIPRTWEGKPLPDAKYQCMGCYGWKHPNRLRWLRIGWYCRVCREKLGPRKHSGISLSEALRRKS